jgi:FlaG/FlaF family flagellin (archaellin)
MRHRTVRVIPALASVLAVAVTVAVAGCATATATAGATSASSVSPAASATASATRTRAPVDGPFGPDPACVAALKAGQTLQARQGKDQNSESAIDQDFTNFANALNAAAQHETHPATAKAMTTLADDYTALVESQSGAAQLPDLSTIQGDGAAFDKACSNS